MTQSIRRTIKAMSICSAVMTACICGGCIDPPGGASDVPCVVVDEWFGLVAARLVADGVVITVQSEEDLNADNESGGRDFEPHRIVYRFDPASEEFLAVDDSFWDNAEEPITDCCVHLFEVGGFEKSRGGLYFDGVPVALGGKTLVRMAPTVELERIAVLSTDGRNTSLNVSTGQHYHQVFSVETGEQIGPTLRIGVGQPGSGGTSFFWSEGNRFVIYYEILGTINPMDARICIVDTQAEGAP